MQRREASCRGRSIGPAALRPAPGAWPRRSPGPTGSSGLLGAGDCPVGARCRPRAGRRPCTARRARARSRSPHARSAARARRGPRVAAARSRRRRATRASAHRPSRPPAGPRRSSRAMAARRRARPRASPARPATAGTPPARRAPESRSRPPPSSFAPFYAPPRATSGRRSRSSPSPGDAGSATMASIHGVGACRSSAHASFRSLSRAWRLPRAAAGCSTRRCGPTLAHRSTPRPTSM